MLPTDGASLGKLLRTKREAAAPPAADRGRPRRTPGLRRDDVAEQAGISVDWYARLEQDRAASVSADVLERLAGVLGMSDAELDYARILAGQAAPSTSAVGIAPHPSGLLLVRSVNALPCCLLNLCGDILASNTLHRELFLGYGDDPQFGRNVLWFLCCEPKAEGLFGDRDLAIADAVARFRLSAAGAPQTPRLDELIGALLRRSPEFRRCWGVHEVEPNIVRSKVYRHPKAGELQLRVHSARITEAPDQTFMFFEPCDDRATARMQLLAA